MLSERATFNLALIIRQGQDHTYADAELCAAKRLLTTSA